METNIFTCDSISYAFDKSETEIKIQLKKNNQIEAEKAFTLDQLKKEQSFFIQFTSLQGVLDQMISLGKENQITLKEKNDHYEMICLTNQEETPEAMLTIPKMIQCGTELINQESMKVIKSLFDNQTALIQQLTSRIDLLESKVLKKDTKEEDVKTGKILGFLNEEEKEMLSEWLDNPTGWKLLYHPSKGTDTYSVCEEVCYGIPSILVLVETTKGVKFGGYTAVGWDRQPANRVYKFKSDEEVFLFSIDKKKKYQINEDHAHDAICAWRGYCLCFAEEFNLYDGFLSNNHNVINLNDYGGNVPINEINNGEGNFGAKQVFVYQVLFSSLLKKL